MSRNAEVAALLEEFADLLDAKGVEYKPRAYRRAAENVAAYPQPVEELAADGPEAVQGIEGVGEAISEKVVEYVETGKIRELAELREELPVEMASLTAVEGVGPKTVGALYGTLGVRTLDDLEAAAEAGEIREVDGFGAKTEENILENLAFARKARERELLGDARPIGVAVRDFLLELDGVVDAEVCGSLRRWRETIGDVDVLAAGPDDEAVVEAFTAWERADDVVEAGTNKASVRFSGFRVDLRVVVPEEFGAALQYFTGSRDHNIRLRNHAIANELKVNEYGVFDVSGIDDPDAGQRVGDLVAGETEEAVYEALGMPWIPPEMREDRGEIRAALDDDLPDPVADGEIRGDLHVHTTWSDGNDSIAGMVEGAAAFGHDYLCISDHATGPGMVGGVGLADDELVEQIAEIEEYRPDAPIDVFAGVETNVDAEGNISTGDDVLAELDLVVASPHSALGQDREAATERLVRAVSHPAVDVLGHPSGRLINRREGLDYDVARVVEAAAEHGTALEVNASPHRLDLPGENVRAAIEAGATIAIDTDAHSPAEFSQVTYGVHTARRGWAETADVLNARDADGVRAFLH